LRGQAAVIYQMVMNLYVAVRIFSIVCLRVS
jgi:hypothetical protein